MQSWNEFILQSTWATPRTHSFLSATDQMPTHYRSATLGIIQNRPLQQHYCSKEVPLLEFHETPGLHEMPKQFVSNCGMANHCNLMITSIKSWWTLQSEHYSYRRHLHLDYQACPHHGKVWLGVVPGIVLIPQDWVLDPFAVPAYTSPYCPACPACFFSPSGSKAQQQAESEYPGFTNTLRDWQHTNKGKPSFTCAQLTQALLKSGQSSVHLRNASRAFSYS